MNKLYTLKDFYEVRSRAGCVVNAYANHGDKNEQIKIYIPYKSYFETSATCDKVHDINTGDNVLKIHIPKEKVFGEEFKSQPAPDDT